MAAVKGRLYQVAQEHPDRGLVIKPPIFMVRATAVIGYYIEFNGEPLFVTIRHYTRERDARRALRSHGYIQEGKEWRQRPKSQQAA